MFVDDNGIAARAHRVGQVLQQSEIVTHLSLWLSIQRSLGLQHEPPELIYVHVLGYALPGF
jgi:hypothetical protein